MTRRARCEAITIPIPPPPVPPPPPTEIPGVRVTMELPEHDARVLARILIEHSAATEPLIELAKEIRAIVNTATSIGTSRPWCASARCTQSVPKQGDRCSLHTVMP